VGARFELIFDYWEISGSGLQSVWDRPIGVVATEVEKLLIIQIDNYIAMHQNFGTPDSGSLI